MTCWLPGGTDATRALSLERRTPPADPLSIVCSRQTELPHGIDADRSMRKLRAIRILVRMMARAATLLLLSTLQVLPAGCKSKSTDENSSSASRDAGAPSASSTNVGATAVDTEPPEPPHVARVLARITSPELVAASSDALYVVDAPPGSESVNLVRVAKGDGAKSVIVPKFRQINRAAVVGESVFFLGLKHPDDDFAVWKVTTGAPSKVSTTRGRMLGSAGESLAFVTGKDEDQAVLSLMAANTAKPTPIVELVEYKGDEAVAGDQKSIFYFGAGALRRVDVATKSTSEIARVIGVRTQLIADATHVYWSNTGMKSGIGEGSIWRAPIAGGVPELVAANQNRPWSIGVDDRAVYWINNGANGTGTISKRRKDGGVARVIVGGLTSPTGIVVDAASIYWVGDGAVAVTAK